MGGSLRGRASTGVKATAAANGAVGILAFIQVIVLARFLDPEDFGVANMAIVIAGFATLVADLGIGGAIVHRAAPTRDQLDSLFWMNLVAGVALTAMVFVLAPLLADAYGEERLTEPARLIGLAFLGFGVGTVCKAVLERELAFGALSRIELAAGTCGFVTAVATAAAGADALAIIYGYVILTLVRAALFGIAVRRHYRPRAHFARADVAGFLRFGLPLAGQRGVNFVSGNADFILVGRILGSKALGYYALAYNLANVPSARINLVVAQVFFPLFARVKDDAQRVKAGYLKLQGLSTLVNAPLAAGLAVAAPLVVPVVYGARWEPAVVTLQILAGVGFTRAVAGTIGPLLLVKGRTDLGFRWSLVVLVLQVPAILVGTQIGTIEGVAAAFLGAQLVVVCLNYRILVRALLGPCLREYVASMARPVMISVVTAAAALPFVLLRGEAPGALLLGLALLLCSGLYIALNRSLNRAQYADLMSLVRGRTAVAT